MQYKRKVLKASAHCIFFAFLIFSSSIFAASFVTPPIPACSDWSTTRLYKTKQSIAYQWWLDGYITGLIHGSQKDILDGLDSGGESVYRWVDRYCISNPSDGLNAAGMAFANALLSNK